MKRIGTAAAVLVLVASSSLFGSCRRKGAAPRATRVLVLTTFVPYEIDPYKDTRHRSRDIFANLFDPLVRRDAAGEMKPCLAESWSNPTPDIATFHLKSGVRFHDGEPLTASSVVAALERARGRDSAVAGYMAGVVEVSAPDPATVKVRCKGPQSYLVQALSSVPITKGKAHEPQIGTGPYRLQAFSPGSAVTLRRFVGYAGDAPDVEEAVFKKLGEPKKDIETLASSPWAVVLDPPDEICGWAERDPRFLATSQYLRGALTYLAFGFTHESPFRDVRVRRAVRAALDPEALLKASTLHGGLVATQLLPPGVFGYDAGIKAEPRDLDAARRLLREAGWAGGFPVELDANEPDRRLAEGVASQLAEIGIRARPEVLGSEAFRQRIDGESVLYVYNWVVGGEAEGALRNFLHTRDPEKGWGSRNRTGYSNPRFDTSLEEAARTIGPSERLQILQRCMRLLNDDLPWIPLYSPKIGRVRTTSLDVPERPDDRLVLSEIRPIS